jgi:hypothetical protein
MLRTKRPGKWNVLSQFSKLGTDTGAGIVNDDGVDGIWYAKYKLGGTIGFPEPARQAGY